MASEIPPVCWRSVPRPWSRTLKKSTPQSGEWGNWRNWNRAKRLCGFASGKISKLNSIKCGASWSQRSINAGCGMSLTTRLEQYWHMSRRNTKTQHFQSWKPYWNPFGITQLDTDRWGAYEWHLEPVFHTVDEVHTQAIERKHLTVWTRIKRLARKTIYFSKSAWLHDRAVHQPIWVWITHLVLLPHI